MGRDGFPVVRDGLPLVPLKLVSNEPDSAHDPKEEKRQVCSVADRERLMKQLDT